MRRNPDPSNYTVKTNTVLRTGTLFLYTFSSCFEKCKQMLLWNVYSRHTLIWRNVVMSAGCHEYMPSYVEESYNLITMLLQGLILPVVHVHTMVLLYIIIHATKFYIAIALNCIPGILLYQQHTSYTRNTSCMTCFTGIINLSCMQPALLFVII